MTPVKPELERLSTSAHDPDLAGTEAALPGVAKVECRRAADNDGVIAVFENGEIV